MTKRLGLTAAQITASLEEAKRECDHAFSAGAQQVACYKGVDLTEEKMRDRSLFLSGKGKSKDRDRCPPGQIFDPLMENCVPAIKGISGLTIVNVGIAADRARMDCNRQGRRLACVRAVGVVETSLKTLHPITRDLVRQSARGATTLCSGPDAVDCRRGVRLMVARLKELKSGLDGNGARA